MGGEQIGQFLTGEGIGGNVAALGMVRQQPVNGGQLDGMIRRGRGGRFRLSGRQSRRARQQQA